MTTLHALFIEFDAASLEDLIHIIGNRIDWYTEMLYDDPWNSWAVISRDRLQNLLDILFKIPDDAVDPECCFIQLEQ